MKMNLVKRRWFIIICLLVIKQLDPIKELYDLYLEEKDFSKIVKVKENIDLDLSLEGRLVDPYLGL